MEMTWKSLVRSTLIGLAWILSAQWGAMLRAQDLRESAPPSWVHSTPSLSFTIRVAAISFVPAKFDLPGNVVRLEAAFRSASQAGAKIAVAPEGVLEGYVVNEVISGKATAEEMKKVALRIDDPILAKFQQLAVELKLCLVFGFAESIGDELFNCAVFIDSSGHICGKHHKMQLAEGSHSDWWFNRLGSHSRAFDTPFGRCGIMICNERWNPKLAKILALDGAQFLLIPSYGSCAKDQDEAVLRLATDNHLPVVEANVGVTMIVDKNRISFVDRESECITVGDITIAGPPTNDVTERDRIEREFLEWRHQEMAKRYEQTIQRNAEKSDGK